MKLGIYINKNKKNLESILNIILEEFSSKNDEIILALSASVEGSTTAETDSPFRVIETVTDMTRLFCSLLAYDKGYTFNLFRCTPNRERNMRYLSCDTTVSRLRLQPTSH